MDMIAIQVRRYTICGESEGRSQEKGNLRAGEIKSRLSLVGVLEESYRGCWENGHISAGRTKTLIYDLSSKHRAVNNEEEKSEGTSGIGGKER